MNIFQFSTDKNCWIFDFLILVIELMISCLPKRLRLIFESPDPTTMINRKQEIIGYQSGDFHRGADHFF
jgi:hypothetical protein